MKNKIILGTVQFGVNYGINNKSGKIPINEIQEILNHAYLNGINQLDTAASYGISEQVIGEYLNENTDKNFKLTSKLLLTNQTLEDSLESSIKKLKIKSLETILFHSYDDYFTYKNEIKNFSSKYKGKLFNNIGVSAYTNGELEQILTDQNIDLIQMPFNILDNASKREMLYKKVKSSGKLLHTRSVFLQGLIFKKSNELIDNFTVLKDAFLQIESLCNRYNLSINELALKYVISKDYINGVLLGVDSLEHLITNIRVRDIKLPKKLIEEIDNIDVTDEKILNPTNWLNK